MKPSFFENTHQLEEHVVNQMAWERFVALGLPEKKTEAFRYFPLRQLYEESFAVSASGILSVDEVTPHIFSEAEESTIVFIDGVFQPHLSRLQAVQKHIVVLSLDEAAQTYSVFLKNRMAKILPDEKNPFVALNLAVAKGGAFIYIPPRTEVARPIQCLQFVTKKQSMVSPRIHLFVGAGADVAWITHHVSLGETPSWSNSFLDIALEEGAHCHHTHLIGKESESWHFDALRATLKKESQLESVYVCTGGKSPRLDAKIILSGENGDAHLQGLWALDQKKQAHIHTCIEHQAPACRSMQRFKGVLRDFSQSSFEGKIFVRPIAQKTEAYQINNNLILNDGAFAYTKPNLEIFADDVKASHGATVTQLGEPELFYLKTRGLSETLSKKLLVKGFCQEILEQIPYPLIKEAVRTSIDEMLR